MATFGCLVRPRHILGPERVSACYHSMKRSIFSDLLESGQAPPSGFLERHFVIFRVQRESGDSFGVGVKSTRREDHFGFLIDALALLVLEI